MRKLSRRPKEASSRNCGLLSGSAMGIHKAGDRAVATT
jgi:hypothetical protein